MAASTSTTPRKAPRPRWNAYEARFKLTKKIDAAGNLARAGGCDVQLAHVLVELAAAARELATRTPQYDVERLRALLDRQDVGGAA
ncbi:MAG: hypothetical protein AB7P02_00060 [Alphaproteobacteria bacterium]